MEVGIMFIHRFRPVFTNMLKYSSSMPQDWKTFKRFRKQRLACRLDSAIPYCNNIACMQYCMNEYYMHR